MSNSAGHQSKTGKKHRLSGLWADKYVATENMKLLCCCNNDPDMLAVSYNVVLKITNKTAYYINILLLYLNPNCYRFGIPVSELRIKNISPCRLLKAREGRGLISRTTWKMMTWWRKQRMRKEFPESSTLQKEGGTTYLGLFGDISR